MHLYVLFSQIVISSSNLSFHFIKFCENTRISFTHPAIGNGKMLEKGAKVARVNR